MTNTISHITSLRSNEFLELPEKNKIVFPNLNSRTSIRSILIWFYILI